MTAQFEAVAAKMTAVSSSKPSQNENQDDPRVGELLKKVSFLEEELKKKAAESVGDEDEDDMFGDPEEEGAEHIVIPDGKTVPHS